MGFCECPRGEAFNATSCRCQPADPCPTEEAVARPATAWDGGVSCFNGMHCLDPDCSCDDLRETLFEPAGRFCVAPRGPYAAAAATGNKSTFDYALYYIQVDPNL